MCWSSFPPCSGKGCDSLHMRLEVFNSVDRSPGKKWFRHTLKFVAILAPLAERAAVTRFGLSDDQPCSENVIGRTSSSVFRLCLRALCRHGITCQSTASFSLDSVQISHYSLGKVSKRASYTSGCGNKSLSVKGFDRNLRGISQVFHLFQQRLFST